ncbi:unnamed protein product [Gadus morhua 'NCC']
MSNASQLDSLTQRESSVSVQSLISRPLQPIPDPSASKRVCFYKSGDPKFGGHRMVVNGRTFKTFDALLDALSKKVPLPFGVRTISTPRGTHSVRGLEDLHDGGSYVCSDRRRVKPLNLDVVHRRKVPWNTTRPPSTGRRSYGRRNEGPDRADKIGRRVSVRTPKRLVVVKNRDSTVKRTVLLQKRTAPTFDALLDYLSQVMQFPVLKLYSSDGRRVDGLAALILCSGVIVAAGNEPFRLGNYNTQTSSKYNVHTIAYMSQSETDPDGNHTNMDMETQEPPRSCIMPQDEDIEKSFRVNQDGSMTVEMKVRLTIKEEELLHWTTTLSRSSLNSRTACASSQCIRRASETENPGLVTDDCGSETSVNAKKEEVERDSLKDGYQERLTESENEVEHGEEFEKVLHKEEVLEETQDEDNHSLKSVKAKRERDEAGEDNIEDDMERWKEEEASTPEVGEDVNKEILEVKSEEEEWCKQGIDEKELDKGQTEPGEFTDSNKGEATGDSSGEMGFTDKENEVDEEDEEPEVVEEKEADSVEDELEKGSPIEKEVAEEDDKGESTDEEGEGDVADKEMGEESCEESDEESCRKDIEEGKDEEDEWNSRCKTAGCILRGIEQLLHRLQPPLVEQGMYC